MLAQISAVEKGLDAGLLDPGLARDTEKWEAGFSEKISRNQ
jgi:hypothetical protein